MLLNIGGIYSSPFLVWSPVSNIQLFPTFSFYTDYHYVFNWLSITVVHKRVIPHSCCQRCHFIQSGRLCSLTLHVFQEQFAWIWPFECLLPFALMHSLVKSKPCKLKHSLLHERSTAQINHKPQQHKGQIMEKVSFLQGPKEWPSCCQVMSQMALFTVLTVCKQPERNGSISFYQSKHEEDVSDTNLFGICARQLLLYRANMTSRLCETAACLATLRQGWVKQET